MSLVCRSVKALRHWEELCAPREKALCTGKSSVPQKTGRLSQKAQLFAVLAHGVCARHEYFDAKTKLCATKNRRHNYLKFCAFAKKNAVSLTNQGCKGCQNEALCTGGKKLCVLEVKALCTGGKKLCVPREKALCIMRRLGGCRGDEPCVPQGKSSVHRWEKALCHNSKQTIPRIRKLSQEFGTSRILVLLHKAIGKT